MHITLTAWAARNFNPAPCNATVLKWNKLKLIQPPLVKVRGWMVDENARFLGFDEQANQANVNGRVADILRAA